MSAHTNFAFFVNNTLLKNILAVVISDVAVVTLPVKLIKFPPTLSQVRCVSAFCVHIAATIPHR